MKNVINKSRILTDSVENILTISFPDETSASTISSENGNIVAESMTLKQSISDKGNFGGGIASEFSVQLISNEDREFNISLTGKWINVSLTHKFIVPLYPSNDLYPSNELFPGGQYETETVPIFSGYIDEVTKDQSDPSLVTIKAYDILAKMNTYKITKQVYLLFSSQYNIGGETEKGAPLSKFLELCTSKNPIKTLSYTCSSDIQSAFNNILGLRQRNKPFEDSTKDVTSGDILRWISELVGAYAVIKPNNSYGTLSFITKGSDETYNDYYSCEAEDYKTFPYSGVLIPVTAAFIEADVARTVASTYQYRGDLELLTVCLAPRPSWIADNNRLLASVTYEHQTTHQIITTEWQDLYLTSKRITDEQYISDYGDRAIYAAQFYIEDLNEYRINSIRFAGDNSGFVNWTISGGSTAVDLLGSVLLMNDDNTTLYLSKVLSDFNYYDMTNNIFAWDEVAERLNDGGINGLSKITQIYNNGLLKSRIGNSQYQPFKATVVGRTWVEVGDFAVIKVPDIDFNGSVYDSVSGQRMDCDGYLVDETGTYIYADGTTIPMDEDTGEYEDEPVSGTVRTINIRSQILSRTLTGISALQDEIEAKGE